MSAVSAAPSTTVETLTQDAPAPQVAQEATTTLAPGSPEPPAEQGTEPAPSEQPDEQLQALASWRDEQTGKVKAAAERAHEFQLAQSRNDLNAQHRLDIEAAKADPVVEAAREAFALAKKGFTEGWDDPQEAIAEFKKLVGDNDGFARIVADQELENGRGEGSVQAIKDASAELYQGLSPEAQNDLAHYVITDLNDRIITGNVPHFEGYQQMRVKRDEILLAEHERLLAPIIEARVRAELGAAAQAAEPGAVKVNGRSAVGGPKTYLDMSPEERAQLTPAERDAITAKYLSG